MPHKPKQLTCPTCGNEVVVRNYKATFCSVACAKWRGGRRVAYHGKHETPYLMVYTGAKVRKAGKYTAEHILVAEKALGRRMKKGEVVHHINGDTLDNRNSNLLVCSNSYHKWLHAHMSMLYQREHFGYGVRCLVYQDTRQSEHASANY